MLKTVAENLPITALDEGLEILRIPLFCQEDSAILVITYKKELITFTLMNWKL
jgi:hypothetical protein